MPKERQGRKAEAKPETTEISALELHGSLSDTLSRVAFGGERVAIKRHGKRIAALVSAHDLAALEGAA